ncbi:MAG TPA: hypothetical protein VJ743_19785 [Albitalea sp.]|nr:hypothetical protein [Albitalea sp.]
MQLSRVKELEHKMAQMHSLAQGAVGPGNEALQRLSLNALREAAVALVLAHERVVLPALRSGHWKNVRTDALESYVVFKHAVAALLLHADRDEAAEAVDQLLRAADRLQRFGTEVLWPVLDDEAAPSGLSVDRELHDVLDLPDRSSLAADEPPMRQLIDDAAVVLSALSTDAAAAPRC